MQRSKSFFFKCCSFVDTAAKVQRQGYEIFTGLWSYQADTAKQKQKQKQNPEKQQALRI